VDKSALFPRIRNPRLAFIFALAGALSFWLPDVVLHIWARQNFSSLHVRIITFVMPATFLIAYVIARRFAVTQDFKWLTAAMLLGVWITGGLFMALSATVSGGGFAGPDGVRGGLLMALLGALPPITLMEATYDGGGLALLAATLGPLLIYGVRASGILHPLGRSPR
jgi:hypothetical protein